MSSEILTIDLEPGTVKTETLPSGAVRVTGVKWTPKPAPTVVSDFTVSDAVGLINITKIAKPGAVVHLRAGTYKGNFVSQVSGTAAAPITFRAYPGERVILDGLNQGQSVLTINGAFTHWQGIEITMSGANRSAKMDAGANVFGVGTKLINCSIHDCGTGVGLWTPAIDAEVYGCAIYNNGYVLPDRKHGHGIYLQNLDGLKRVTDCLVFNNYYAGLQFYGSSSAGIKGLLVDGGAYFNNGGPNLLIGGESPSERITVQNLVAYQPFNKGVTNVQVVGWKGSVDAALSGNYFAGGTEVLWLQNWSRAAVTSNTLISASRIGRIALPDSGGWVLNGNDYIGVGASAQPYSTGGVWRTVASVAELGARTFVRPNRYEAGRAHVAVLNFSRQSSVSVDLSSALKPGEAFQVFNVADLSKPALTGVFSGGAVLLPTLGEMNAYLIRKVQ